MQIAKHNSGRVTSAIFGAAGAAAIIILAISTALFSGPHTTSVAQIRGFYVIYYGPLVNLDGKMSEQAARILQTKPMMAIVVYSNQNDKNGAVSGVIRQLQDAGIKVITYTWTKYGTRNIDDVQGDIKNQLTAGADGIFIDEVTNLKSSKDFAYYSSIYQAVKDFNQSRIVIMNPGHYNISQSIMKISDIVSFEEDWVNTGKIPWKQEYPANRFMGVSSNEYCNPPCVTGTNAENKTIDAWNSDIGYHFATDKYTRLPNWYESYASKIEALSEQRSMKNDSAFSSISLFA